MSNMHGLDSKVLLNKVIYIVQLVINTLLHLSHLADTFVQSDLQ